jgi:hypothetical protein
MCARRALRNRCSAHCPVGCHQWRDPSVLYRDPQTQDEDDCLSPSTTIYIPLYSTHWSRLALRTHHASRQGSQEGKGEGPAALGGKVPTRKVRCPCKLMHSSSSSTPSHPRYDTHRLEDLVAQDDIVSILTNLIDSENLPHLLLYGPPGTGKTSTIVAAAKRMYGSEGSYKSMTLELNASDSRGIDVSGAEYVWMCVCVCGGLPACLAHLAQRTRQLTRATPRSSFPFF